MGFPQTNEFSAGTPCEISAGFIIQNQWDFMDFHGDSMEFSCVLPTRHENFMKYFHVESHLVFMESRGIQWKNFTC